MPNGELFAEIKLFIAPGFISKIQVLTMDGANACVWVVFTETIVSRPFVTDTYILFTWLSIV